MVLQKALLRWGELWLNYMGVSENYGTPKSSILIGFSIINHPFWGTPIFGNIHICINRCIFFLNIEYIFVVLFTFLLGMK